MTVTLLTAMSTEPVAADEKAPQVNRGYAPVNGLKMYYELHGVDGGKNPPLVLFHGGGSTIDTTFGKVLPSLAKSRQVVAFEQQGHGRTADMADRPFSFEQSADDTVALMDHLKIEKADLFGFSNGAISRCRSPFGIRTGCASWWSHRRCSKETASIPKFGNS